MGGEAAQHANDTINITAKNSVTNKSPFELFTGHPSKLIPHTQPFGRVGKVILKRKIKGKLREKSQQRIVVQYAKNTTPDTYQMYNPRTRHVLRTRDVSNMDGLEAARSTDSRPQDYIGTNDSPTHTEIWDSFHPRLNLISGCKTRETIMST